jgi:hypothetical protein
LNWNDHLLSDENLVWQGKPAPRCYTLRNWPHSLFGLVLLIACLVWFYVGINIEQESPSEIIGWVPVPFLLASLYLVVGHLILARLEWNSVYYAVTNQRVLVNRGVIKKSVSALPLGDITWFSLKPYSETLGTVSIRARGVESKLIIACIEHPRKCTDLLEAAMRQSGAIPGA